MGITKLTSKSTGANFLKITVILNMSYITPRFDYLKLFDAEFSISPALKGASLFR